MIARIKKIKSISQYFENKILKTLKPITAAIITYPLGSPFVLTSKNKKVIKADTTQKIISETKVAENELKPNLLMALNTS